MVTNYIEQWRERRRRNREIAEELAFHLELCIEENRRAGMSDREAFEEARMRFGDIDEIHSTCRQLASETEPDNADPAITYSPLSVPMGVWLLLGTIVPAVLLLLFAPHLLRPLPYANAERIYATQRLIPLIAEDDDKFSFFRWHDNTTVFEDFAGFSPLSMKLRRPVGGTSQVQGLAVTRDFFRAFGVDPLLGRTFSDGVDAATPSVVLSYRFWRELGGDTALVGRNLVFNRRPMKVVGVMPESFWFLSPEPRFWLPMEFAETWPPRVRVVAKLRDGVAPGEIGSELATLSRGDWKDPDGDWVLSLPGWTHRNVWAALSMMLVPLTVTLALGCLQIMSLCRLVAPARLKGALVARYYAFLLAKSALALLPAAAVWLVLTESSGLGRPLWLSMGLRPMATIVFLMLCAAMVWWSLVDQKLRCPVCFQRLRMPVSFGRLGSILFELPATEYICTHGHGTLHVPEPLSNELETTRWRPHGDVWEELLAGAKK